MRAGGGFEVVQLHQLPLLCFLSERDRQILYRLRSGRTYGSPSTATRKSTAFSMPLTAGLSGSSRVWLRRRKPNDWTVALTEGMAPIALFRNVAFSVFAAAVTWSLRWIRGRRLWSPPQLCRRSGGTHWPGAGRRSAQPLCPEARRSA